MSGLDRQLGRITKQYHINWAEAKFHASRYTQSLAHIKPKADLILYGSNYKVVVDVGGKVKWISLELLPITDLYPTDTPVIRTSAVAKSTPIGKQGTLSRKVRGFKDIVILDGDIYVPMSVDAYATGGISFKPKVARTNLSTYRTKEDVIHHYGRWKDVGEMLLASELSTLLLDFTVDSIKVSKSKPVKTSGDGGRAGAKYKRAARGRNKGNRR